MFNRIGIIFLAAILLSGCSSTPTALDDVGSQTSSGGSSSVLNWSASGPGQTPVAPAVNPIIPSAPPVNPPPAIVPKPKPAPVFTYTSLNRWMAELGLNPARLIAKSPLTTYAVSSANGVLVLGIGSLGATWNGVEVNLGFDPQMIDGEVFLHGLDLQKNLEPLLTEPPISFPQTNRVVVIDPGHGGDNHGTFSVAGGRFEKDFTLDWARRLKPLLETEGWTVFLTRTGDYYVTNADRVAFAGARHADVFISLHFNSSDKNDSKASGLETYCITPIGMPSTLTRGYADPLFENLPNNNFDEQNLRLAVRVHSALLRATGIQDRGVRRARFETVLRGQNRPAILVEGGYLSNPHEAALIESADYRQKLAEGVAAALK